MEILGILALIITLISMKMKRVVFLLMLLLNCGTSFIIIKYFHSEIYLLQFDKWTVFNLLNGNNYWKEFFIYFIFTLLLFYCIIPLLLINKLKTILNKYLYNLSLNKDRFLKRFFIIYVKKIVKIECWFLLPDFQRINNKNYNKFNDTYSIYRYLVYYICIIIHLLLCLLFLPLFKNPFSFILIIIIITDILWSFTSILFLPLLEKYKQFINDLYKHEILLKSIHKI